MEPITDTWVDKSKWGDGPWQEEPDRAEWRDDTTGLPCLALRANPHSGSWCGYVAVPPGHPWHGLDYTEFELEGLIEVHGGLTFTGPCMTDERPKREQVCHVPREGEPDDVWWLGFDCAHAWDICPGYNAANIGFTQSSDLDGPRYTYRTTEYVRGQCERLAAAVKAAA